MPSPFAILATPGALSGMSHPVTPIGNLFPREVMVTGNPNLAKPNCQAIGYEVLPRWAHDDHAAALEVFRKSATMLVRDPVNFGKLPTLAGSRQDWQAVIESSFESAASNDPRRFFERHFIPCRITDPVRPEGLFTGYFEPVVQGSRTQSPEYPVPVYRKPDDLQIFDAVESQTLGLASGKRTAKGPQAYDTREAIETGSLSGRHLEICWLNDWTDAFFMHIQGSGRVELDDGTTIRLGYAAKSGRPYVAIGSVLAAQGVLPRETISMQSLTKWMKANSAEARILMWQNPSFIFFRELDAIPEYLGAMGGGKVHLTPERSLAIDANHYLYGTPLWLETTTPPESLCESLGGQQVFHRLMIAQDTGSAIRGLQRGDVYWGWGAEAALRAGHMKSPGQITALLPLAVVARLGLQK
jgi:membrane-bound lytic murein transglycosylase A